MADCEASLARTDVLSQLRAVGHWRGPALLFAVCSGSVLLWFRQTVLSMVQTWYGSRSYSHCFLILPLFFYLVWVRRERVARLNPVTNYWGLPLVAGVALVWLIGNLGEVKVLQEFAVMAILVALVGTFLGTPVVRALRFPLLFLFFAVPFGVSLVKPLQDFTAWFVIHALTISHIPAVLENHIISLPSGEWAVAEACSGLRFLLSAVVLGSVFASLAYQSRKRQLIFMFASIAVPVVANGLRAYGIVLLAHLTNNRVAAGVDHIVYGTVFSVFVQLLLIIGGLRWRQTSEPDVSVDSSHPTAASAPPSNGYRTGRTPFVLAGVVLAVVAAAPLIAARLWNRAPVAARLAGFPVPVNPPWQLAPDNDMSWIPEVHGADGEFRQTYRQEKGQVRLSWAQYSGRRPLDLAAASSAVANTGSWVLVADGFRNATIGGQNVKIRQSLLQCGSESHSIWTLFSVNGEYTANPGRVRFLQAKARLLGKTASVAVIRLGADNRTDASEAERLLQDFLHHASFPASAGAQSIS